VISKNYQPSTMNDQLITEELVKSDFPEVSISVVNSTMELADKAFKTFRNTTPENRAIFLEAIAEEILALGDTLVEKACAETGLPAGRIEGERGRTMNQLRLFADLIREGSWVEATIDVGDENRQPMPKPDVRKMLVPTGPVVVFAASNFPLAFSTAGGDTASALAAGNPVIVKAHSGHPGTSELVATAIAKAADKTGMPNGVFTLLHGPGSTVGQELVKHPLTKSVGFTGSEKAGRILFNLAAEREVPVPVFAEMGSINPVVVLPQALQQRAEILGQQLAQSVTLGAGQFCTNPGLIVTKETPDLGRFINSISEEIQATLPAVMLNGGICNSYEVSRIKALEQQGIEVLSVAKIAADTGEGLPTVAQIDANRFLQNPLLAHEVFGPFTLVVKCKTDEGLEEVIASLKGQLTATVMAEKGELSSYKNLLELLNERSGRVIINGVPTGVEVCHAMHHGGPFPASTDSRFTSVGTAAIKRFVRPLCYQNWPDEALPDALKNDNPQQIWRTVNGGLTQQPIV
jgi:alpha-ketoglutaric semialdehyde dehydrogenase